MTTNVGPMSLARNNERSMTRIRSPSGRLDRYPMVKQERDQFRKGTGE